MYFKQAGIDDKPGWHIFRITFTVNLIQGGADLESVQQLLGHSDISTTQPYLNVTDQHLDKTVDMLCFKREDADVIPFIKP